MKIRFRFWNKIAKRMMYEMPITMEDVGRDLNDIFEEDSDNIVFMMDTGLKDKNGKEIYEGDIVHWLVFDKEKDRVIVDEKVAVYFDEDFPGYYVMLKGDAETLYYSRTMKYLEIIGNIYENPELLKKEG